MLLEVGLAEKSAVLLHELVDLVGDFAPVESVAAFFADQAERIGETGIFENVAFGRRAAFPIQGVSLEKGAGLILVSPRTESPVERDQLGNGKTFLGITNCRREIVSEFEFAELLV